MPDINYVSSFAPLLAEGFKLGSVTEKAFSKKYQLTDGKTIKIMSMNTSPTVDYNRSGRNRFGDGDEVGDTIQELTMGQDRAFRAVIDAGNKADQMGLKSATKWLKQEQEEVMIPEIDLYRLKKLSMNAGIVDSHNAPTKETILDDLMTSHGVLNNKKVPNKNRTTWMRESLFTYLLLSPKILGIDALGAKAITAGNEMAIRGHMVKSVPDSYFPNGVNYIILYKGSAIAPSKLQYFNIFHNPEGTNGDVVNGRFYHDCFVIGKQSDGLYISALSANIAVMPTISVATNTVTLATTTSGAIMKYTTDGTDPKYSITAAVYSAPFSIADLPAGTYKITAVAQAPGGFSSPEAVKEQTKA